MNPWLFVFLVSVVIFILLIDRKTFKVNMLAGLICVLYIFVTNIVAFNENLWVYSKVGQGLPHIFIFINNINIFLLGAIFFMGILFVQFLPQKSDFANCSCIYMVFSISIAIIYFRAIWDGYVY